jgi:hypothetical protein
MHVSDALRVQSSNQLVGDDMRKLVLAMLVGSLAASSALATETISYTFDAKGRLIKVVRSGTVNNGTTTTYTHDKANNRSTLTTVGASH